jgi:hypothetical protein
MSQNKNIIMGDYLVEHCDPNYQYPCMFSGIPTGSGNGFLDLIFVCDQRNLSHQEMNLMYPSFENWL